MKVSFYITYALRSLRREGQRSLLALFCIAFGVLALVAMQLLAHMIDEAFLVPPRLTRGGDVTLYPKDATDVAAFYNEIAPLLTDATLADATIRVGTNAILISTPASGHVRFLSRSSAVDPATFPVIGTVVMDDGSLFRDAIAPPGHAVVTVDLAEDLELARGDTILLSSGDGAAPLRLTVGGIARHVPSKQGRSVLFSLDTYLDHHPEGATAMQALGRWGTGPLDIEALDQDGWRYEVAPSEPNTDAAQLFTFMLAAAGILGLLIGGIGVANTMQVMLARRTTEIATLKSFGYQQVDLLLLFGVEALLLGFAGALVGIGLALVVAQQLMGLLAANSPFLFVFEAEPGILASGLLTGMATALIFSLVAIVQASALRPAVLLRGGTPKAQQRGVTILLYGTLLVLFMVLSSLLLGSALYGIGVVLFGMLSLSLLAAVLGGILWVVVKIPVGGLPLLRFAKRNLQHEPRRAIVALIALFIGVFSIGFASAALLNAGTRATARALDQGGYNLMAFAPGPDAPALEDALWAAGATQLHVDYPATASLHTPTDSLLAASVALIGRSQADLFWDIEPSDSLRTSLAIGDVLLPGMLQQIGAPGDSLVLTHGTTHVTVRVAGYYAPASQSSSIRPTFRQLVLRTETVQALQSHDSAVILNAALPTPSLNATTSTLGKQFSTTMLINKADLDEYINRMFTGFFYFVIALAGLSFVAGAVLIANSVGITMVERRRELGILKAVGYTSRDVLNTVVLENALLGFLAGVFGLAGVLIVMAVVNIQYPSAHLGLTLMQGLALIAVSVTLACVSAVLVAWHPTHTRPAHVLRQSL